MILRRPEKCLQSSLLITSLVMDDPSASDENLIGTDLFPLKLLLHFRIFAFMYRHRQTILAFFHLPFPLYVNLLGLARAFLILTYTKGRR